MWNQELDAALVTVANGGKWYTFTHGWNEPNTNDVQLYVLASLLEIYQDGAIGWQQDGPTKSGINVPVGIHFVATNPIGGQPTDIEANNRNGIYTRAFGACYVYGQPVGACVAVVNPDADHAHPMPAVALGYLGEVAIDNWCGTATLQNLGGSYCYKGDVTEEGDTGKVYTVATTPLAPGTMIPPATAHIYTQLAAPVLSLPHRPQGAWKFGRKHHHKSVRTRSLR